MSGYDSESFPMIKFLQENFGQSATQFRIGTRTKFINQEHGFSVAFLQKVVHVFKSVTVGTQMIFNRLVVSDIRQDSVEQKGFAAFVNGNQHTGLQHQLQQSNSLQRDCFSSGIGPRNHDDSGFLIQFKSLGMRDFVFLLVVQVQNRVEGISEIQSSIFCYRR